jgi:Mor family transcriptional regulator
MKLLPSKKHISLNICNDIKELYESGINSPELAKKFKTSAPRIRWAILRAGGSMRSISDSAREISDETCQKILSDYETGVNGPILAKKYSVCTTSIHRAIYRMGGRFRTRSERQKKHNSERFARIYQIHSLTEPQYWAAWRRQKGLCYYCLSPLPKNEFCTIDHFGGKKTLGRLDCFRGLCCPDGWCNVLAGFIEKYPKKSLRGLFTAFHKRVKIKLPKRYFK